MSGASSSSAAGANNSKTRGLPGAAHAQADATSTPPAFAPTLYRAHVTGTLSGHRRAIPSPSHAIATAFPAPSSTRTCVARSPLPSPHRLHHQRSHP